MKLPWLDAVETQARAVLLAEGLNSDDFVPHYFAEALAAGLASFTLVTGSAHRGRNG